MSAFDEMVEVAAKAIHGLTNIEEQQIPASECEHCPTYARAALTAAGVPQMLEALREVAEFDAFQGGPIAPIENPTTTAMRAIARAAIEGQPHE